jgi:phage terminase Nu1 subunit (DNA packaging protein)
MTDRLPYPPPFMDTATLAAHLSVSPSTVKNWAAQGVIPAPRKRGGTNLWKWSEVEERLTMGRVGDGPDPEAERLRNASRAAAAEARPRH